MDVYRLKGLMPYIGTLALEQIHMGMLSGYTANRQKQRVAVGTAVNTGMRGKNRRNTHVERGQPELVVLRRLSVS